MREIPVYKVRVSHREHPRHEFTQIFIGKLFPDDVIAFVESMPRRDTYQFVIDVIKTHGLPKRHLPAQCNPDTKMYRINARMGGDDGVVTVTEKFLPLTANFSLDGVRDNAT